jgi:hypothetical protein
VNQSPPNIIFGLKDYPRPRQSGFFYHKPPTIFGNFKITTLAVLDLYITDEAYLSQVFSKGIDKLLTDEAIATEKEFYLTNYATENMKDFVKEILHKVIQDRL